MVDPKHGSSRRWRRLAGLITFATLSTLLLAACGGSSAPAPAAPAPAPAAAPVQVESIRMSCWSQPVVEQTAVFASQENGYFKDEKIDFTFVPGAGNGDSLKNVLAGNADIAFTGPEAVLFAADQGSKLKGVYAINPQNGFNVVIPKKAGITGPAQLKGKKVGVLSLSSGTRYGLMVLLKSVGLSEQDVEVLPVGSLSLAPLMEGKVDAEANTDVGLWTGQQQGLGEVNVLWARDVVNYPTNMFVTTEEIYNKRQGALVRFLRAYRKGAQWVLDNPEKAAELAVKYATDGKDVQKNLGIIKVRNQSAVSDGTRAHGLGWQDLDILQKTADTFYDLKLVKQKFDAKQIWTNDLINKL